MSHSSNNAFRKGTRRPFPKHRQTVLDIVRAAAGVPSFPIMRTMNLSSLDLSRQQSSTRIGWTTLFAKGFALVSAEIPELRDVYVAYPFHSLYQHPHSVASLSIHRTDQDGNERLIWGRLVNAESMSLIELQNQLDLFCKAPLNQVYRDGLRLEKSPALIRRFVWWWTMKCSGRKRAKHMGTFSISSLGGQGALNAHHPLVTTTSLAFGPIHRKGECEVVLISDHRVLDGVLAAKALQQLELTLNRQVADELRELRHIAQAAA